MCLVLSQGSWECGRINAGGLLYCVLNGPGSHLSGASMFNGTGTSTPWRSVLGRGHGSRVRLGQSCQRQGDHCGKCLWNSQGYGTRWKSTWQGRVDGPCWWGWCPLPPLHTCPLRWPPLIPWSAIRGMVPPMTDHCPGWPVKAFSWVYNFHSEGLQSSPHWALGGPERNCDLPGATKEWQSKDRPPATSPPIRPFFFSPPA